MEISLKDFLIEIPGYYFCFIYDHSLLNPANDFILPAEWEKQQYILLSFPDNGKDWPGKYHAVKWAFIEIIRKISVSTDILLLAGSDNQRIEVTNLLQKAHIDLNRIRFLIKSVNRVWMRDSGPVIVRNYSGERKALHFGFNGWAKYRNYMKDISTPGIVAGFLGIPVEKVIYNDRHVILEGGAIDVNGKGTLVTTEECLLDQQLQVRNPGFGKKEYEEVFRKFLGIKKVIWLGSGIEGDDTHGHVDDICRFVNQHTVVACRETNTSDSNYKVLEENFERLKGEYLADGSRVEVVELPMPDRLDFETMRLPASYANFLITEGNVLVPTFNDPKDRTALGILSELFPGRNVIGISAIDLIWGLGTIHCLSHEIPA